MVLTTVLASVAEGAGEAKAEIASPAVSLRVGTPIVPKSTTAEPGSGIQRSQADCRFSRIWLLGTALLSTPQK